MKKLITAFVICVMGLTTVSATAFAADAGLSDASTEAVSTKGDSEVTDDTPFGVILDADGNIVETLIMPRGNYVNSVQTIPAGGSLITYQYQPSKSFTVEFNERNANGTVITASGIDVLLELYMSKTIGGSDRERLVSMPFTTRADAPDFESFHITYNQYDIDEHPDYPYYNGKIVNLSTTRSLTFRLVVSMD